MNIKTLETNLSANVAHLQEEFVVDLKAEAAHIADPSQCGNIVRRHFDGLTMTLLLFVVLFVAAAALGIFLYTHR